MVNDKTQIQIRAEVEAVKRNLEEVVKEVTKEDYQVNTYGHPTFLFKSRDIDLYIVNSKLLSGPLNPCDAHEDPFTDLDEFEEQIRDVAGSILPIEVKVKTEKDIVFFLPKFSTDHEVGRRIAEAYEEKYGKDIITLQFKGGVDYLKSIFR